jgi:biotin carboxyl carrier protein
VSVDANDAAAASGARLTVALFEDSGPQPGPSVPSEIRQIDVRPTDLGLSLLDCESHRVLDVAVTERPGGEVLVQLPHVDVRVVVDGRRYQRAGRRDGAGTGDQHVTAPMPGRVLRFLVQAGDDVTAGQGLVVIEAMKMENELTATRPGRVREVLIVEGGSVESGRLLLVIE